MPRPHVPNKQKKIRKISVRKEKSLFIFLHFNFFTSFWLLLYRSQVAAAVIAADNSFLTSHQPLFWSRHHCTALKLLLQ